jgi:hypothetical protein
MFCCNHQHPERTEIAGFQAFLGKPAGAQAVVVGEVGSRRRGSPVGAHGLEPEGGPLDEVRGRETVRRAASQRGIEVAPDQSHIVILRKPRDDHRREMVDHERTGIQNIFVGHDYALGLHRRPRCVLEKKSVRSATKMLDRGRVHEVFRHDPRKTRNVVHVNAGCRDAASGEIRLQRCVVVLAGQNPGCLAILGDVDRFV